MVLTSLREVQKSALRSKYTTNKNNSRTPSATVPYTMKIDGNFNLQILEEKATLSES